MLDAAGDLRFGGVAELEFVEDVAGVSSGGVGVPESGVVRAGRRQLLMADLRTDRGGQFGKAKIDRRERCLDAGLLFLVRENLSHAIAAEIGIVSEPQFVVLVISDAPPEANGVDPRGLRTEFSFTRYFGLVRVDPRVVILAVNSRSVVERVVLCDGEPDESANEQIRCSDGLAVGMQR